MSISCFFHSDHYSSKGLANCFMCDWTWTTAVTKCQDNVISIILITLYYTFTWTYLADTLRSEIAVGFFSFEANSCTLEMIYDPNLPNFKLSNTHCLKIVQWKYVKSGICFIKIDIRWRSESPYLDLSKEKCGKEMCVNGGVRNLDWR